MLLGFEIRPVLIDGILDYKSLTVCLPEALDKYACQALPVNKGVDRQSEEKIGIDFN
jgi:hypothetical protein